MLTFMEENEKTYFVLLLLISITAQAVTVIFAGYWTIDMQEE